MIIYAILIISCMAILTFIISTGSKQMDALPRDMPIPPGFEYYEYMEKERRERLIAMLVFAIVMIIAFLLAKYGLHSL
ncbi:MAG: hypothetical protein R2824_09720 [Saprospiraceae bacterium]|nr:hypothetical protein [Lewinella sp.]